MSRKTYTLEYVANLKRMQRELGEMPGMTDKAAARSALAAQKHFDKMQAQAAKAAQKSAKGFAGAFKGITLAISPSDIAAVAGSVGAAIQHFADLNNDLADTSTRTGVTVRSLAGLKLAFEGSGLSSQDMQAALAPLPMRLASAAKGSGEAAEALKKLGFSGAEVAEMAQDPDKALQDITARLSEVEEPGAKAALAMQIFGKSGGKLLQAGLAGSAGALEAFSRQAELFGVQTGPQAAQAAADWQRATAELTMVFEGMGSKMTNVFGGSPAKMLENFTLGTVAAFEKLKAKIAGSSAALSFLGEQIGDMISGDFSLKGMKAAVADLAAEQAGYEKTANDNIRTFWEARQEIKKATGAIEDHKDETEESIPRTVEFSATQQQAARAAAKQAMEVDKATAALQKLRDANAGATDGIDARLAKQLRELDELEAQLIASDLYSQDAMAEVMERRNQVIADAEAARWEMEKKAQDQRAEARAKEATEQKRVIDLYTQQVADAAQHQQAIIQGTVEAITATSTAAGAIVELAAARGLIASRKAFNIQKALSAASVTFSGFVAAAAALQPPPVGLGPVLGTAQAVVIGAGTVASLAQIASQKPPTGHRGLAPDELMVQARRTEAVLNPQATAAVGGSEGVRALNRGEGPMGDVVILNTFKHRTLDYALVEARSTPGRGRRSLRGQARPGQRRRRAR